MKALVNRKYGTAEVLSVEEVAMPVAGNDEVLIKVMAASINRGDWYLLNGKPFFLRLSPGGLRTPRITILGGDVAGRVEAVGKNVSQFQVGDPVYGDISNSGNGAFAEYVAAPESVLALKPRNLPFAEAAALPSAAVTALQGLRAGGLQAGQQVLINGASGGVGTYAVQLAKAMGGQITAVCSTGKMEMVRALGADKVIDYTQEDFTRNGRHYDLILGINGYHALADYRRALRPNGVYVAVGGTMRQIFAPMLFGSMFSGKEKKTLLSMGSTNINQKDLVAIKELVETGQVKPVVDGCFPLDEARGAMHYFGAGHARGKVVITMGENSGKMERISATLNTETGTWTK